MSLVVTDLNVPAARLLQFAKAFGDTSGTNAAVQGYCDGAAADVARLTAGYILDNASLVNFGRAIALFRIYAQIGPVPSDVQKAYDDAWKELQSIAKGERTNLPQVPVNGFAGNSGGWGSDTKIKT